MPENLELLTYIALTKRWLDPDELAIAYNISKSTQAKMRMENSKHKIPFSKVGSKYIRYDRVAIDNWLEDHKIQG